MRAKTREQLAIDAEFEQKRQEFYRRSRSADLGMFVAFGAIILCFVMAFAGDVGASAQAALTLACIFVTGVAVVLWWRTLP
jgi:hypothetical protein